MDAGLRVLSTVLCLSQALVISCSAASLSFLSEPVSVVQSRGSVVQLRCSVRPSSARLSWRFRGQPLDPPALPGAEPLDPPALPGAELSQGSLTLPSLQPSDVGLYQCVAHSDAGAITSRYARVAIAEIAEYVQTRRRVLAVREGGSAVIECPLPPSEPPAAPRLRARGERLEVSTGDYVVLASGNLQIVSVSPQHQGLYKCGAYNPVTGETRVEAHGTKLTVKHSDGASPVQIVYPTSPKALQVEQSRSLTLECVLTGSPPPTATWLKDGEEVVLGSGRKLLLNNLVMKSVKKSDGGEYQCSVLTETGPLVSVTYTVSVLAPASVAQGLTDQSVPPGSSVHFTCVGEGSPAPNITWLFNSDPLAPSPRLQISGSSLGILAVTSQDEGMYQCLLDNGIGSAQSAGRLILQSGLSSMPAILSPPSSGTYQEGDVVSLSCNASGQPLPVIRWYNADGPISTHPALLLLPPQQAPPRAPDSPAPLLTLSGPGSSSLYIQAVTQAHAGRYVCRASNQLGSVQAEAVLSVELPVGSTTSQTPPTVSDSAHLSSAHLSSAHLSSAHPIQNDEGDKLLLPEEIGDKLGDKLGDSFGAPERTSDQPTPEAPIIISPPQTHKPDLYDLEWRAGRDWGSPINAYFVKYRKVDDMGSVVGSWHTVRVPGSEKSLRLSELEASSLYEVLMVARSAAGDGQPAMLTFRTGKEKSPTVIKNPSKAPVVSVPAKVPEDKTPNTHFGVVIHDRVPEAPDKPTISMATESSVYVTWIPRANGGSPITAFRVEYRRQGRSAEWLVAADNISPLKLSVEVRSMEPGSTYRFRVVAMNMYGESPHSATSRPYQVSAASPRFSDRPVAGPHISSTDAVSDTQIMLRWTHTPSSNNNTPIQGFYVYYRPTDSDNDSDYKRDVVEGLKQKHLIGQLQPETSYDIKMQCFNGGGESEYSNVMICETKARQAPGVPSQPVTPPGPHAPDPPSPPGGLLYLIVGCVLGVMVLILLVFIAMCLWRNRQQNSMHKYDPPGYLYQPAEMNGHVLEYTSLPGGSRVNGGVHGGYGHGGPMLPQGCHLLHHKLPNGSGGLYPSGHDGTLTHNTVDYQHSHPHHHNGGGMYAVLPQTESPDCMSCQNFCNNNRCYTKTNGTYSSGTLPLMHHLAPCQQDLEMLPLGQVSPCHTPDPLAQVSPCHTPDPLAQVSPCHTPDQLGQVSPCHTPNPLAQVSPCHTPDPLGQVSPCHTTGSQLPPAAPDAEAGDEPEGDKVSSLSQHSCWVLGDLEQCPGEETGPAEEPEQCVEPEDPVVCWERLALPNLDCNEKTGWISTSSLAGELIQPVTQEA